MSIIKDELLAQEIINDLMETYKLSELEATDWVAEHAHAVVSDMWDAYYYYLESFHNDLPMSMGENNA